VSMKESLADYNVLSGICDHAKSEAIRNPDKPVFGNIILPCKIKKDKKRSINEYFDSLQQKITELCILDMITAFECKIFQRVDNAHGKIEKIVKEEYGKRSKLSENSSSNDNSAPFHIAVTSFVKDQKDIYNLSGVKSLLGNKMGKDLSEKLADIIEHRNWLSHGKRIGVGKESSLTIDEIYKALNDIFDRTGNKIPEHSASEEEI